MGRVARTRRGKVPKDSHRAERTDGVAWECNEAKRAQREEAELNEIQIKPNYTATTTTSSTTNHPLAAYLSSTPLTALPSALSGARCPTSSGSMISARQLRKNQVGNRHSAPKAVNSSNYIQMVSNLITRNPNPKLKCKRSLKVGRTLRSNCQNASTTYGAASVHVRPTLQALSFIKTRKSILLVEIVSVTFILQALKSATSIAQLRSFQRTMWSRSKITPETAHM